MGSASCSFLKEDIAEKLQYVIRSIIIDRPSTKPFKIGDASSRYRDMLCEGHPTHKKQTEVDIDYPLISGKSTQYGKYLEGSHENIQLNDDPAIMILDESKIDQQAIQQLLIRLRATYKGNQQYIQYIIHEKIFDLICKKISPTEGQYLYTIVMTDQGIKYCHHTHIHLKLDGLSYD